MVLTAAIRSSSPAGEPRLILLMGSNQDRETARKALASWESFQGDREIVLVVMDWPNLERDLLAWLDVVPRGRELAPYSETGLALLRARDVRRLPCFLYFDGRKTHRTYGIPKEVATCSR